MCQKLKQYSIHSKEGTPPNPIKELDIEGGGGEEEKYNLEMEEAILKCLGLESSTSRDSSSSSSEQKDDDDTEASPQQSRSSTQQGAHSSSADSPSTTQQDNNTFEDDESASVLRRRPTRPPISSESRPGDRRVWLKDKI
ncbi:hypothetical protein AAG906_008196 [Vitis piasezkii]